MSDRTIPSYSRPHENLGKRTLPERRAHERIPVRDLCEMVMTGSGLSRICMVHNLTAFGAMIETSAQDLPQTFLLVEPGRSFRANCRIVWRKGQFIGVEFITPVQL